MSSTFPPYPAPRYSFHKFGLFLTGLLLCSFYTTASISAPNPNPPERFCLKGSSTSSCDSATPVYLNDSNPFPVPVDPRLPPLLHGYPRISQHEMVSTTDVEGVSKYQYLNVRGSSFLSAEKAAAFDVSNPAGPPNLYARHISGHEFQGYTQAQPYYCSSGPGFATTGPATQWNPATGVAEIFAGHWLYEAGTLTTQPMDAVSASVTVEDGSRFSAGEYAVIYGPPAGSFTDSEHVKIVAVAGNVLTLERAYKSNAVRHPLGSIVAQHVLGQGTGVTAGGDGRLWTFNFSSQCPRDSNGLQWNELYARFLARYYNRYKNDLVTTLPISGIHLDTDLYFDLGNPAVPGSGMNSDSDNNLVTDWGRDVVKGTNYTGEGLDTFYRRGAELMPGLHLIAGVHDARGYPWYNGIQMENWLDYGNGDFHANPKYGQLNSMFAMYLYSTGARSRGPSLVQCLSKTPTQLYPVNPYGETPLDNRPARLGLALCAMDQGYYGHHSNYIPDAWFDEYSVNLETGAAVPKLPLATVRQHRGWLGDPLGPFQRIVDPARFTMDKSLLANGTFEEGLAGWTATFVDISKDLATVKDGLASLKASGMTSYRQDSSGAFIKSAKVPLVAAQGYTLVFSAKAPVHREITVAFGSEAVQRIPVGPTWRRYVIGFNQKTTAQYSIVFGVGRENSEVWLDTVGVFAGNANVFRRDFENGIVLANATPDSVSIDLGGTFRRILGTQDPAINNGQTVSSVTVEAYDGLLLLR